MAEVTIMAYLRAYKAFHAAKKRAEDLVTSAQRAAMSLKDWHQLKSGNTLSTGNLVGGNLPFDPKDWPSGTDLSKAIQDHQAAHQALHKNWGALGADIQLGLQPPPVA